MFLLFGAFFAGALTVLAPCVLPLLPIIIGGSMTGNIKDKKRPLVIALSLAASLIVFTLLLKATTLFIDIPPQAIAYFSGSIIVILGLFMLFPLAYANLIAKLGIEYRVQELLGKTSQNKSSLIGPIITGAVLGPVFSSCSPVYAYIIATILPVNFGVAFAYIIAYVAGLSVVLLLIGYYGQRFIGKIKFASDPKGAFQKIIAVLFIIVGLLLFTGYDKKFQTYISEHTPFNFDALSSQLLPASSNVVDETKLFNVTEPYKAPEFTGLNKEWVNSAPQTLKQLRGKVVLVDFWTYSCINCIRNNPYIESWYQNYKDDGFVVIGVHAPEFAFEKVPANVKKGVKDQGLTYPVALDNDFSTWNTFNNRSWPTSYLIDAEGNIRRIHEGEGQYKESEQAIRALLSEKGVAIEGRPLAQDKKQVSLRKDQTPETYLGTQRADSYAGNEPLGSKPADFSNKETLNQNQWTLAGSWDVSSEKITARNDKSRLRIKIAAKDVYVVAGADSGTKKIQVKVNGKLISKNQSGKDVKEGMVTIGESRLYHLLSYPSFKSGDVLEITGQEGVSLNVFTFGS